MKENRKSKKGITLFAIFAGLIVLMLFSFIFGRYDVSVKQVVSILTDDFLGKISGGSWGLTQNWTDKMEIAVLNIRLPRILMAVMVGLCLSAAGASYQGVFQNPMASPDVLGASSGAAFGAALAILIGCSSKMIMVFAFAFSLLTVGMVFIIGTKAPGLKILNLILAGIMISSLFTAGTSYIKLVADPSNQLPAITYWLMGSLSGTEIDDVKLAVIPMAVGCFILLLVSWRINILALGDEEAHTLGVNTDLLRLVVVFAATLVTASSIAAAGMIGWVGLVIPHVCRKIIGSNYRWLMPASMFMGGGFLLLVDNVSRNLLATEIPIGILTAFVGAPFFVYLIIRQEKTI